MSRHFSIPPRWATAPKEGTFACIFAQPSGTSQVKIKILQQPKYINKYVRIIVPPAKKKSNIAIVARQGVHWASIPSVMYKARNCQHLCVFIVPKQPAENSSRDSTRRHLLSLCGQEGGGERLGKGRHNCILNRRSGKVESCKPATLVSRVFKPLLR